MDAPQSGEDVSRVVEELQLLDPLLDVRWEPRAVLEKYGGYDAMGKLIAPIYRGLWEVIHHSTAVKTAEWREWTRVCFVTKPVRIAAGLDAMPDDGEYAPLGPWLVEFLRQADQHNLEAARRRSEQLDAMNERLDQQRMGLDDAAIEELCGRQYHEGTKAGGGVSEFHPVRIDLKA